MSRITSMKLTEPKRISIRESVEGEGSQTHDALQNLLDNMERRCAQIRLELLSMRGERP